MRLGIDLGGSKTEIIALADDGCELLRERVPTPRGDYAATVATIAGLVESAEQKVGAGRTASVGIGIPGAESRITGLIKNANSTWLIGQPLRADLEAALGRPVRLANDANCFALSEATDGAAAGAEVVFGVILGTGVGGGIVVNGQVLAGANAIAGEWGHNPLSPLPGDETVQPKCYCGRHGCIETFLSGPALVADGGAGNEAALQRYELRLARALAQVINLLDPNIIVLGGGVSNLDRLYDRVPRLWGEFVFSDAVATRLLKNKHGDSSGVRGAAWLWND